MGLAGAVVRVLSENDHPYVIQRRAVERVEAVLAGGKQDFAGLFFGSKEFRQALHVGLAELFHEMLFPAPIRPELAGQYLNRAHGSVLVFPAVSLVFRTHGREQDNVAD